MKNNAYQNWSKVEFIYCSPLTNRCNLGERIDKEKLMRALGIFFRPLDKCLTNVNYIAKVDYKTKGKSALQLTWKEVSLKSIV